MVSICPFGAAAIATQIDNMADSKPETVVPIRDTEKHAATEQEINPWDVQAAHDDQGNVLAFDYVAISQYAVFIYLLWVLVANRMQKMGHQTDRRTPSRALRAPYGTQATSLVTARSFLFTP